MTHPERIPSVLVLAPPVPVWRAGALRTPHRLPESGGALISLRALVPLKAAAGWSIVNAALLAQDVALVASKVSIAGIWRVRRWRPSSRSAID